MSKKLSKKLENYFYDLRSHRLRYFLLCYVGKEGYVDNLCEPNSFDPYKIDLGELEKRRPMLYKKLDEECVRLKVTHSELLDTLGFKISDTTIPKIKFFNFVACNYLDMLIFTNETDISILNNLSKKYIKAPTVLNKLEPILKCLSSSFIKDIEIRANYYEISREQYMSILLFSTQYGLKKFNIMKHNLNKKLREQIFQHCQGSETVYKLIVDVPPTYKFLKQQAKLNNMSNYELLSILCYPECYSHLPNYLNNEEDQKIAYQLNSLTCRYLFSADDLDSEFKEKIVNRCLYYKTTFMNYIKGLRLFARLDILKSLESTIYKKEITINRDRKVEDYIKNRLSKIYNNKVIPSLFDLKQKNAVLYDKIFDYSKKLYMTDIDFIQSLGFIYKLKYGTKEYAIDNIHKYVYDGQYFCAYADDHFYWMLERMFRPTGTNKHTKESEQARKKFIESLGYIPLNANSSKLKEHKLYITPHCENGEVILSEVKDILEHFNFNGVVFLPARTKRYQEVIDKAHSLGLHLTELIHTCGFDRRNANGKIEYRSGDVIQAESVRGICKLYAPIDEPSFNIDDVINSIKELKKVSSKEELENGYNIIKKFQEILPDYADDNNTVFLGRNSELYKVSKTIVGITKVQTIVLILNLGYNVYYETEDGANYIEAVNDIFEALLREKDDINIEKSNQEEIDLEKSKDGECEKYAINFPVIPNNRENILLKIPRKLFEGRTRVMSFDTKKLREKASIELKDVMGRNKSVILDLSNGLVEKLNLLSKEIIFDFESFISVFADICIFRGTKEDFKHYDFYISNDDLIETEINGEFKYVLKATDHRGYRKIPEFFGRYNNKYISYSIQKKYKKFYFIHRRTVQVTLDDLKKIKSEPKKSTSLVGKWIRNPELVNKLKEFYKYKCQLCGEENDIIPIIPTNKNKPYVEVHHIRELSASLDESEGTDIEVDTIANALVVCPYHHKLLHYYKGGLNKLVRRGNDCFITNKDETESIRIIINKHLLIE